MEDRTKVRVIPVGETLPPIGSRVIVVCKEHEWDYRCVGYRDAKGVWRGEAREDELKDVIGWMEFDANG